MTHQLLRNQDGKPESPTGGVELDVDQKIGGGDGELQIVCAACGHELTRGHARAQIDGSHRHVKVNPHGNVYHIACFQPVPGVLPIGSPSPEFSWFAGCRWQIALCGGCSVHVGWTFSGQRSFCALIEGRFIEKEEDHGR